MGFVHIRFVFLLKNINSICIRPFMCNLFSVVNRYNIIVAQVQDKPKVMFVIDIFCSAKMIKILHLS